MSTLRPVEADAIYKPHVHLEGKYAKGIGDPEIGSNISFVVSGKVDSIRQERKGHKDYGIEISAVKQAIKNILQKGGK